MLCKEIIAVCPEIHTKQSMVMLWNLLFNLVVQIITTGL
jgi:hypothetical protein